MSDPQRPEREAIERLSELLAKATPGPWEVFQAEEVAIHSLDGLSVVDTVCLEDDEAVEQALIDAELICELRNLAPALLAALPPTPRLPCYCCSESGCSDGCMCSRACSVCQGEDVPCAKCKGSGRELVAREAPADAPPATPPLAATATAPTCTCADKRPHLNGCPVNKGAYERFREIHQ
jgi:hypothetical protein